MTMQAAAGPPTADFGTRFSAFMVDAALLFAGQWLVFLVLSRQLQAVGLTSTEPCVTDGVALCQGPSTVLWAILVVLFVTTTVGYHAAFEGRYGATPGKKWMGLVVVDRRGHSPVAPRAAVLRSLVRQSFWLSLLFVLDVSPFGLGLPPALFLLVPLITLGDFVWGAVHPDGLAVHDLAAGTQVVRAEHVITRHEPVVAVAEDSQESEESV